MYNLPTSRGSSRSYRRLFTNRDYVFNRRFIVDCQNKTIIIKSQGTEHLSCPIKSDKFRVKDYWSFMVIKPQTALDKPGIEFSLTYFDNPGINIPAAVTTWVAMRAMPDFLSRLRDATKGYKAYCTLTGKDCICNIYKEQQKYEEEQRQKNREDLITDNTISEPQTSLLRNMLLDKQDPDTLKPYNEIQSSDNNTNSNYDNSSGSEIIIAPSPTIQAESDKHTYLKYMHPYYYFS